MTAFMDGIVFRRGGTGSSPGGAAGGDLGGTYPNPTVTGINGGTVQAAVNTALLTPGPVGATTPGKGLFSYLEGLGPAAVTSFAGTASRATNVLTFTSAADAISAGYDAIHPALGTTVVLSGNTMVILSWTNATTAVVDSSGTIAGATPTSAQAPIQFGVNSAGTLEWATLANGNVYFAGNVGIGTTSPGTALQIYRSDATVGPDVANAVALDLWNPSGNANTGGQINFRNYTGTNNVGAVIGFNAVYTDAAGTYGNLYLSTRATTGGALITPFKIIGSGSVANTLTINSGNVGIGTTNPTNKLQVDSGGSGTFIALQPNATVGGLVGSHILFNTNSNSYIWATNSVYTTPTITISNNGTGSGNVGIGTTSMDTGALLTVAGGITGWIVPENDSSTGNVAAADMKGQIHRVTGAYTRSLPTAAVGYNAIFDSTTAAVFSVKPLTGTDVMVLNGVALTAGNKVTSGGTAYERLYVECNVAGIYECYTIRGVFSDGGV